MAAHLKETDDSLASKLIDHIERARAIRGTSIITQVEIVILG
jgi:hypothetical protein